jgi:hypothetical protein
MPDFINFLQSSFPDSTSRHILRRYQLCINPWFSFHLHLSRFQHKNQYFFIVFVEFDSTRDRRFLIGIDGVRPQLHHRSWSLGKFMFGIKLKVSYRFFLSRRV